MSKKEGSSRIGLTNDQIKSPLLGQDGEPGSGDKGDFSLNASSIHSPRDSDKGGDEPPIEPIAEKPAEEASPDENADGPIVKIDPADDIPNNTSKFIDFNAQLEAHIKRTEAQLPYTLTQVEDAMFIDQYNVVTLEYHYYQENQTYTYLDTCDERWTPEGHLVDGDGERAQHMLGTETYMDPSQGNLHPMNAFDKKDMINYADSHEDIVKNQRSLPRHERTFEYIVDGKARVNKALGEKISSMMSGKKRGSKKKRPEPEYQMIEGIVALYKINNVGGMQRYSQAQLLMGRKFFPSKSGNMELTRSRDKKVISLTNFDRDDANEEFFKIKAWTSKLAVYRGPSKDEFESLHQGLNHYFAEHKETFDKLLQLNFCGNSKFVQLTYLESVVRDLPQQQAYELEMERLVKERRQALLQQEAEGIDPISAGVSPRSASAQGDRELPRKAKKYAFFDVANGNLVFEYGGIQEVKNFKNQAGQQVPIYELGCLVKEIREENFEPQIVFYFAGDFMDPAIKNVQMVMKWAMNYATIKMKDLFSLGSQEEKMSFVHKKIQDIINRPVEDGHLNYYPFDNSYIDKQIFNWEQNITVRANRKFDQVAILNQPIDKDEYPVNSLYIHGTRFKQLLKLDELKKSNYTIDIPYFTKLNSDGYYRMSRNMNVKDQIFYDQIKNGVLKTFCVRPDQPQKTLTSPGIKINNYVSQHDIWLQMKKNFNTGELEDIFQTIHVTDKNQFGMLQTELPPSMKNLNSSDDDMIEERRTSDFYQNQADLPCIAYNLGDNQICIQNTYQMKEKKSYIIKLAPDEKFVTWLTFNQFEDIGFYPVGLRIECCSHFAFLTTGQGQQAGNQQSNRINLIFIDPFYIETQVARFRSQTFFDNEMFSECDTMIKTCLQSSMGQKRSTNYKTYIWSQYPDSLVRSKVLRNLAGQAVDSDNSGEETEEDESDVVGRIGYEQVPMLQDENDFIYYIIKQNGMCEIMEGNPRDPYMEKHESIISIKADKCLAFSLDSQNSWFFFMDQDFIVYHLKRNISNRHLSVIGELTLKEIQTLDFKPRDFDPILMNNRYVVQGNKIFYFYDNQEEPYPEGILESEDLVVEKRGQPVSKHVQGPLAINGSFRYFSVYQVEKFTSHMTVALKPDSTSRVIINDFLNFVDMSTFLEDGKILIKIRRRFMVFNCNGAFLDEAQFDDSLLDSLDDDEIEAFKAINDGMFSTRHYEIEKTGQQKLIDRRKNDPILDFDNNEYKFAPAPKSIPLSEASKMDLLNMSYNNRWWLFYNRIMEQFYIYKFVCVDKDFKFKLMHQLSISDSFMFKHMSSLGVDPVAYFRANTSQIKIDDKGCVKLCYVENLPIADVKDIDSQDSQNEISVVQCRLVGSIFTIEEGKFMTSCQSFMNGFEFPRDAQEDLQVILDGKKADFDRKIRQNCKIQQRKPPALRDYAEFENMIDDLTLLEGRNANVVYAKIFFDNLVIIYCGKYVKYGWLTPNKKKTKKKDIDMMDLVLVEKKKEVLHSMNVYFGNSIEVIKMVETDLKNTVQVVTIDHESQIFTILTWNFNDNIEQNCKQTVPDPNDQVGYHVVKGMNLKMNYLLNQHHLIDLEHNIPIRQTKVDQKIDTTSINYNAQLKMIGDLFNQRKVFQDGMKFLGVEKASSLFYPLCRMDLILWRDINALGEEADLIEKSCTVEDCNIVIDGISLFHYFADNSDLIEAIHTLFLEAQEKGNLSHSNSTMPLQCLNPDHEGKSALYRAIASQAPASFECMIEMIIDFPEYTTSKMVLKSFALILSHESETVIDFFENNIYQPPQMQEEQFVPGWTDEMEQFVFPSHTSVISKKFLIEEMAAQGIDVGGGPKKQAKKAKEDKPVLSSLEQRAELILKKKNLRPIVLDAQFDAGLPEGEKPLKRVQLEALDFDWIFDENNAKVLLRLLATEANNTALVKKSIMIFVDLMWSKYQPAIIYYVFVPYMIMLVNLSMLASGVTGNFVNDSNRYDSMTDEEKDAYEISKYSCYTNDVLAVALWMFFGSIELPQLFSDPMDYLSDVWNWIDIISITLNAVFLTMCSTCIFTQSNDTFSMDNVRSVGGFACFFMWIKVFYWMRLFASLAYYVKLIMQTISDSMPFMTMVAIIIFAFGNYFYVIQNNLNAASQQCEVEAGDDAAAAAECGGSYWDEYYFNPISDVLVSTYLLGALGAFDSGAFAQGPDSMAAMSMFLLATFIIAVVFMNMLIAIMGETFGSVQETSVESGLRERVVLISDHAWLLDLKKIFKGKKYIIIVTPSVGSDSSSDPVIHSMKESEFVLNDKLGRIQNGVTKKIDCVDVNTRFLLAHQKVAVQSVIRKVKTFEKLYDEQIQTEKESADMTPEEIAEKKMLNQKKAAIMKTLNEQTNSQKLTVASVKEVAQQWMEIADKDGNGHLDIKEFTDFFSKAEGAPLTQSEITTIFNEFDTTGDQQLSVEEFARAIYNVMLADQEEYTDDEDEIEGEGGEHGHGHSPRHDEQHLHAH